MVKIRSGRGVLLALSFAVVTACPARPDPPPRAPMAAPTPSGPPLSTPVALVDASAPDVPDASPPASEAGSAADASAAGEARAAIHRPDPGPGRFSCGEATCQAGKEVCAPRQECVDRKDMACVADAELEARRFRGAVCEEGCFGWFDQKSCDGPGDCKANEVCCLDADFIIGMCDDGENGVLEAYECKPVTSGRTPCGTAEICSAKDPKCRRPGSTCIVDPESGVGTCVAARRMRCGAAPCAAGLLCVERLDGSRSCEKKRPLPEEGAVVECTRGRDCAPDEGCFGLSGTPRCDLSSMSWAGNDVALCDDARDCEGICGKADAVCYAPGPGEQKLCECRPRCRRSADCTKSSYCSSLSLNRYGGALLPLEPFCDVARGRCDCREPQQP